MAKKGYQYEYRAKKQLEAQYGKDFVIKVRDSGCMDYLILARSGRHSIVHKAIEVKSCHGKKFYPSKREKQQKIAFIDWCNQTGTHGEIWIYLIEGKNIIFDREHIIPKLWSLESEESKPISL